MINKYKKEAIWALAFLFDKAVNFTMLPLVVNLYGLNLFGIYGQIIAVSAICSALLIMGQNTILVRGYTGSTVEKIKQNIGKVIPVYILLCMILGVVFLVNEKSITSFIFSKYESGLIFILYLNILYDLFFEYVCIAYLRCCESFEKISLHILTKQSIKIMCISIAYVMDFDFYGFVQLMAIMQILHITFFIAAERIYCYITDLKTSLVYTFKKNDVVFNSYLVLIYMLLLRLSASNLKEDSGLGLYSLFTTVSGIIAMLYTAVGFIIFPKISRLYNEKKYSAATRIANKSIFIYLVSGTSMITICFSLIGFSTYQIDGMGFYLLYTTGFQLVFGLYQIMYFIIVQVKTSYFNILTFFLANLIYSILISKSEVLDLMGMLKIQFISIVMVAIVTMLYYLKITTSKRMVL